MIIAKSNRINIEAVLKLIILLGFALFFYVIIKTGKVLLYVNPRIVPYVKFGIVVLLVMSLFSIPDIFKPKRKLKFKPYLFFLIPLLMAFSIPAKSMDSTSMALGDVKITQQQNSTNINITPDNIESGSADGSADGSAIDNNSIDNNTPTTTDNSQSSAPLSSTQVYPDQVTTELKMQGDTVVVNDDNFVQWNEEIFTNMSKYEGVKIQIVGFVFKSKDFKENEFVPARLMMSCCTADLQPIGFLCRYNKAPELKPDTWLKVSGTIKTVDYNGEKTPIIIADKVEDAVKPINEYVYPF